MALKLSETVYEILKNNPNKYFKARDLAENVFETKKDDCLKKIENTVIKTETGLINQLVAEISRQKNTILDKDSHIKITADRPRKFYYSTKTDEEEIEEIEEIESKSKNKSPENTEYDLYKLLCQYLFEQDIFPKRINELTSSNTKGRNGNKWLHPDIVGVKNLSKNWTEEVKNCIDKHSFDKTVLYSYEVKIKINLSNVREVFFQTVSNSSWANYSYLVAKEIDEKALDELLILCNRHKIGVINLDEENPSESQILIQAIKKETLDWNMINRIVKENKDFKEYICRITEFYQTGKLKKTEWGIDSQSL